ncbi:hypothetical protein PR002_g32004 [Phytophthora rubi]|uniref:Uncharacterized protein n=1 Tax=Phytophthora rubi TaxID=129364 RepID=A0A6A3GDW7_9STRA|nr:hypothetical protein PR002_g32004 [Phytophthora rubi]
MAKAIVQLEQRALGHRIGADAAALDRCHHCIYEIAKAIVQLEQRALGHRIGADAAALDRCHHCIYALLFATPTESVHQQYTVGASHLKDVPFVRLTHDAALLVQPRKVHPLFFQRA